MKSLPHLDVPKPQDPIAPRRCPAVELERATSFNKINDLSDKKGIACNKDDHETKAHAGRPAHDVNKIVYGDNDFNGRCDHASWYCSREKLPEEADKCLSTTPFVCFARVPSRRRPCDLTNSVDGENNHTPQTSFLRITLIESLIQFTLLKLVWQLPHVLNANLAVAGDFGKRVDPSHGPELEEREVVFWAADFVRRSDFGVSDIQRAPEWIAKRHVSDGQDSQSLENKVSNLEDGHRASLEAEIPNCLEYKCSRHHE
ncbi:hypothetical protein HG531_011290 [Fusarium graminearum]|nr:hypothetical protein HG531_011290 [Fusarium graminearum]